MKTVLVNLDAGTKSFLGSSLLLMSPSPSSLSQPCDFLGAPHLSAYAWLSCDSSCCFLGRFIVGLLWVPFVHYMLYVWLKQGATFLRLPVDVSRKECENSWLRQKVKKINIFKPWMVVYA